MTDRPLDPVLKGFPWATFGRRESEQELAVKLREQRERTELFRRRPAVGLVIALDRRVTGHELRRLTAALRASSYPDWNACFSVGDGEDRIGEVLTAIADEEPRISICRSKGNPSPATLRNSGAAAVTGEWLAFLEPDSVLSPAALYLALRECQGERVPDVIYGNAARIHPSGNRSNGKLSRCAFGSLTLLFSPYFGSDALVQRRVYETTGGFSEAAGEAWEHDFWLRVSELTREFELVPCTLVYRNGELAPRDATAASVSAVQSHLRRQDREARAELETGPLGVGLRIVPVCPKPPRLTVIVPFRDRAEWTIRCVRSAVEHRGAADVDVLLVDNRSTGKERKRVEAAAAALPVPVRLVSYEGAFNFAELHNHVIRGHDTGEILCLLNNDVFWSRGTLADVAAWATWPEVGTVGVPLRYEGGGLQHGGMRARAAGAGRLVRVEPVQDETPVTLLSREVFANTFAACFFRRALFDEIGGLRAFDLANGFGDVAFGLECLRRGYRNLFLTFAGGIHLESASRGVGYEYWEERVLERDYAALLQRMAREDLALYPADGPAEWGAALTAVCVEALRERSGWWEWARPRIKAVRAGLDGARRWMSTGSGS